MATMEGQEKALSCKTHIIDQVLKLSEETDKKLFIFLFNDEKSTMTTFTRHLNVIFLAIHRASIKPNTHGSHFFVLILKYVF